MGHLKELARQGKDKALSKALEVLGETVISRYGKLIGIRLDSLTRRIEAEVLLRGETAPLSVSIENYEIVSEEGKSFITCNKISVSREWMKILADDLLKEKKLEIPSKYAKLLEIII